MSSAAGARTHTTAPQAEGGRPALWLRKDRVRAGPGSFIPTIWVECLRRKGVRLQGTHKLAG